jgi:hypothetical protein
MGHQTIAFSAATQSEKSIEDSGDTSTDDDWHWQAFPSRFCIGGQRQRSGTKRVMEKDWNHHLPERIAKVQAPAFAAEAE